MKIILIGYDYFFLTMYRPAQVDNNRKNNIMEHPVQGNFERPPPFSAGASDLAPRGLGGRGGVSLDLGYAPGSPPAGGNRGSQMVRCAIFAPKTTGFIR